MNQNLYSSRLLELLRLFKNLAQLGILFKKCIHTRYTYIKKYISAFSIEPLGECLWNFVPMKYSWCSAHVYVIRTNVSSMPGGHICFWLVHLFLFNCCLDFKENLQKENTRHARSQVCAFHVVPYTKMTALVLDWLTHFPILCNREHIICMHPLFFFFDFLKCYFRVNIFAYSSLTVSN